VRDQRTLHFVWSCTNTTLRAQLCHVQKSRLDVPSAHMEHQNCSCALGPKCVVFILKKMKWVYVYIYILWMIECMFWIPLFDSLMVFAFFSPWMNLQKGTVCVTCVNTCSHRWSDVSQNVCRYIHVLFAIFLLNVAMESQHF
jgi:hypothetical protein